MGNGVGFEFEINGKVYQHAWAPDQRSCDGCAFDGTDMCTKAPECNYANGFLIFVEKKP